MSFSSAETFMCVCFWLCCCRQDQSVSTLFCLLLAPRKPPGVQRALAGSKAGRLLHVSLKPTSQRAVYWLSTNQSALIGANHFLSLTVCGRAVCVSNQCDVVHYIWEVKAKRWRQATVGLSRRSR